MWCGFIHQLSVITWIHADFNLEQALHDSSLLHGSFRRGLLAIRKKIKNACSDSTRNYFYLPHLPATVYMQWIRFPFISVLLNKTGLSFCLICAQRWYILLPARRTSLDTLLIIIIVGIILPVVHNSFWGNYNLQVYDFSIIVDILNIFFKILTTNFCVYSVLS